MESTIWQSLIHFPRADNRFTHALLQLRPEDDPAKPRICLAGKRACPPEDCGGAWGYAGLLKVLRDPTHPEYKDMKAWVGRKFDSELFDIEKTNKVLRRLRTWV